MSNFFSSSPLYDMNSGPGATHVSSALFSFNVSIGRVSFSISWPKYCVLLTEHVPVNDSIKRGEKKQFLEDKTVAPITNRFQ